MRRRLFWWESGGFLFVGLAGTLLHFVYAWSGQSAFAAAFSAVNESTWEHMKLLFFPMLLDSVVQVCAMGRNYPNFPAVRAVSTLVGLALIPTLFYTFVGVVGESVTWVNIAIFYLAALGAFAVDFRLLQRGHLSAPWLQPVGVAALWALAFLFIWCTFHPPALGLWQEPTAAAFCILP